MTTFIDLDIEAKILESPFVAINDNYLEDEFGHYAPLEVEILPISDEDKTRLVAIQIAALQLVVHSNSELADWIKCQQRITGDTSYNYI